MAHRILLVDDDANLRELLSEVLRAEGYAVESAPDGETLLARVPGETFDLLILDVMLPGRDGFQVCGELRRRGVDVPVLMLTARGELMSKVLGLSLGADDYVTKPLDAVELLARIQALLRRGRFQQPAVLAAYGFGDIDVDFVRAKLLRNGQPVNVSTKELQLLRYLIARRGATVSRGELLREVWGYQSEIMRTVDVHVATLRQKLEENPEQPRYILTVRGEGYLFAG
jgi:DNA-binding response OmpR family regulator